MLPVVSEETHQRFEQIWINGGDKAKRFIVETMEQMEGGENPELAEFLDRLRQRFHTRPFFAGMLVYACHVYRILAAEGPLPIVSRDIGAPMQEEFLRDSVGYRQRLIQEITDENPVVLKGFVTVGSDFLFVGQHASVAQVGTGGFFLYKMLKNQLEADELASQLGIQPDSLEN